MTPAVFQPVAAGRPEWGDVAVLPWDSENFGFVVGEWRNPRIAAAARSRRELSDALRAWTAGGGVELVVARAAAEDAAARLLLSLLGFEFIDCSIDVAIKDLQKAELPPPRFPIRGSLPQDHAGIVGIAAEAFRLDRYHADARFPPEAAELRHRRWMEELLRAPAAEAETWTIGAVGLPEGLLTAVFGEAQVEILLAAVDPRRQAGGRGWSLFAGALAELRGRGHTRCVSKQYAANTAMLNVFARVGFRFQRAQAVYHWHSERAKRLRSLDEIFGAR